MRKLVSLGLVRDFPQGAPQLVRAEGRRLACVRRGDRVDVLDDRCPHEGHALSMGTLRDGVLTCPWHNWKFDLSSGRCLFGGESARRFPVEIVADEVFVDPTLDEAEARLRREEDLVRAVSDGSVDGAVREALRLARLGGDPAVPLVRAACMRTPYGAADALVAIEASLALCDAGILDDAESYAVIAQAVSDDVRGRPERALPAALPGSLADRDAFLDDLLEERRHDAVGRALGLARDVPFDAIVREWLVPFASIKLWDRGATLRRIRAAEALAARLGDAVRDELLVGLATSLGWAVAESDLPAWRATRAGLHEMARVAPGDADHDPHLSAALRGKEDEAVGAALASARAGASPRALLEELATAALERLASYDLACSDREGSAVTAFEPARAVIFAAAALRAPTGRVALAQAVMLAGLVGRLGRYAAPSSATPAAPQASAPASPGDLALAAREGALSPRCSWSSRGRTAALAAACVELATPERAELACAALRRATMLDTGGGLARIAGTARYVVDGRDVDD
jgi:nitrite reductase/ring-hydroxylating ferredoxin subunit